MAPATRQHSLQLSAHSRCIWTDYMQLQPAAEITWLKCDSSCIFLPVVRDSSSCVPITPPVLCKLLTAITSGAKAKSTGEPRRLQSNSEGRGDWKMQCAAVGASGCSDARSSNGAQHVVHNACKCMHTEDAQGVCAQNCALYAAPGVRSES